MKDVCLVCGSAIRPVLALVLAEVLQQFLNVVVLATRIILAALFDWLFREVCGWRNDWALISFKGLSVACFLIVAARTKK